MSNRGIRPELLATAYHEAGHAVMSIGLGRTIRKVSIVPSKEAAGRVTLYPPYSARLDHDAMIRLAGFIAEMLWKRNEFITMEDYPGDDDRINAEVCCRVLLGCPEGRDDDVQECLSFLQRRCTDILKSADWNIALHAVAAQLFRQRELTHRECVAAIEATLRGPLPRFYSDTDWLSSCDPIPPEKEALAQSASRYVADLIESGRHLRLLVERRAERWFAGVWDVGRQRWITREYAASGEFAMSLLEWTAKVFLPDCSPPFWRAA